MIKNKEKLFNTIERSYNKEKDIYFVHIPKCAGRTVKKNFWCKTEDLDLRTSHIPACFISNIEKYKNTKNFCFVRDPYTRLASNYFWQKMPRRNNVTLKEFNDFKTFVYKLPDLSFSYNPFIVRDLTYHFSLQKDWINEKTFFVGKKENLLEDINKLCDILDLNNLKISELKNEFKTKKLFGDYMSLYDRKMIDIVNKIYEQDFLNFDYKMR